MRKELLVDLIKNKIYILVLTILAIAVLSQCTDVVVNRNPKELREMSLIAYAVDFSEGVNPYSLKILEQKLPTNVGCYGFMVPFVVSPLVKVVGRANALLLFEFITILLACLGIIFTWLILRENGVSKNLSSCGTVLMYIAQLLSGGLVSAAFAGQWGMTFLLMLTYLVIHDSPKQKFRPILYVIIIIFIFYDKQYFVFISLPILIYLVIKDRRSSITFAITGMIVGVISLAVVQLIFPLYFSLAIARAQLDSVMGTFDYSVVQLIVLLRQKWFILCSVFTMLAIFNAIKKAKISKNVDEISFELWALITLFIPVMYLSLNKGQDKEYLTQLIIPYVVLIGVETISKYFATTKDDERVRVKILGTSIRIALFFTMIFSLKDEIIVPFSAFNSEKKDSWARAYELLDYYAPTGKIIVPPQLSQYCLVNGIYTDDYGQAEYMSLTALEKYEKNNIYKVLFPNLDELLQINIEYNEEVQKNIEEQNYDMVVLNVQNAGNYVIDNPVIGENYKLVDTIDLYTGMEKWTSCFYAKMKQN